MGETTEIKIDIRQSLSFHRARKENDWLGDVIAVHTIGRYDLVEYWHKPAINSQDQNTYKAFAGYIDGTSTGRSYSSLDEALAGCIARVHDGANTRADIYFIRGIGADVPRIRREQAA